MADIAPVVAARGAVTGAWAGVFALGANVSGPFCPQPDSIKPRVISAAIAMGLRLHRTKLSDCSDIE